MTYDRLHRAAFLPRFSCLGAACEDTCCKGWSMQVDTPTISRYTEHHPDLLESVAEEAPTGFVMRRDPATDICVKLEDGLCSIHKRYGSDFLGDACHFYPRATRKLGNQVVMTATLSCPEIVRLALADTSVFDLTEEQAEGRFPHTVKNCLPEGLTSEQALATHKAFLAAANDPDASPERIMARLVSVTQSLSVQKVEDWPQAAFFFLKTADARLSAPTANPSDPFNLLHAFAGLVVASKKLRRERLIATVAEMEEALQAKIDWEQITIALSPNSQKTYETIEAHWHDVSQASEDALRRWIGAQLSLALFPFGGFGVDMNMRIIIIAVRFATVRLALMSAAFLKGTALNLADTVRIMQTIARFLDHLSDPEFSMMIYHEAGWTEEGRLRALVGDK